MVIVAVANNHGGISGGIGFDGTDKEGLHAAFTTLGLVFLATNAVLAFRVENANKAVFAFLSTAALVFAVVGVAAIGAAKNETETKNTLDIPTGVQTIHSWVGVFTMLLFILSYVLNMAFSVLELGSQATRDSVGPFANALSVFVLFLAMSQVALGAANDLWNINGFWCSPADNGLFNTCRLWSGVAMTMFFASGATLFCFLP
eukprot:CAMPEP_0182470818 /NCGR_PEP_ID=MMETSP1319-20130603/19297_1 /TAXON_ID=172717 /ORGANISM="Bolidomonas pacifica, Strain RCC208" /LENGTH=202 /DNA_ID=CAMNT_0024671305 /DNA_START=20 /DNA_END=625 /DNA_ORIENTATION=+